MADQFDNNARSPNPDAEIDDPLAELARIIGYERPSDDAAATEEASQSNEFDLEAELMRELDVPLAPSIDELDRIEADEALDVILADSPFEPEPEPEVEPELEFESAAVRDEAGDAFAYLDDQSGDPSHDDLRVAEGQSSESLLRAIENEFPAEPQEIAQAAGAGDEDDRSAVLSQPDGFPVQEPAATDERSAEPAEAFVPVDQSALEDAPSGYQDDPIDDQVLADMARFELSSEVSQEAQSPTLAVNTPDSLSADEASREAALDFEEYLSTELDVFEQEYSMGDGGSVEQTSQPDQSPEAAPLAEGVDDAFDVENALEALNDSALDDDVTVFDDAAEELLAAINDDVDFNGQSGHAAEAVGDWSVESIEEGASEELDEELGDMFGVPERSAEPVPARADSGDELEFDLEKILADSIDGDDWAEPVEIEPEIEPAPVTENDDWLSSFAAEEAPPQRDELTEAFQDLLPDEETPAPEASATAEPVYAAGAAGAATGQSDWLAGFDAVEAAGARDTGARDTGSRASSDYYFDAELISEADETVEIVPDIDVPEIEHQEPQAIDPDYDIEIEREFADIIDRNEPGADSVPAEDGGAVYAAAEGWSREAATPRGYEVSDDYIALERELGSGAERTNFAASATADLIGDRLAETDDYGDGVDDGPADADNRSRGPMVAIAVLALAVIAGIGGFGWSLLSGDDTTTADGGPRIIRADKEPVKVLPENPGGVTVPNQDKAVYDRVAGGAESSPGQPALVNSAEEPVDVVQRTLDPEILPLEGRTDFSVKSEERLSAEANGEDTAAVGAPQPVVSPRKVRTMIVKPDGSIVAREVAEPETAAPGASDAAPQALAAASPQEAQESAPAADSGAAPAASETEPEGAAQDQGASETAATEGTLAPVRVVTTQPIRPVANAPVPQGRPADQPVNVVGTVSQAGRVGAAPATATAPAATAAPAPATTAPVEVASAPQAAAPAANPGGYYVQIASQPTVEGAQSSWRTLSNRYSSVLGGLSVDIQRADIPGKGIFHRVRVPAGTRDQANALCTRYKAAGGSCFVSR